MKELQKSLTGTRNRSWPTASKAQVTVHSVWNLKRERRNQQSKTNLFHLWSKLTEISGTRIKSWSYMPNLKWECHSKKEVWWAGVIRWTRRPEQRKEWTSRCWLDLRLSAFLQLSATAARLAKRNKTTQWKKKRSTHSDQVWQFGWK